MRSRVTLPSPWELPGCVLSALRDLHPQLDAYVLKDGTVWLLQHVEDRARIQEARTALTLARSEGFDLYNGMVGDHLAAEGWERVGVLPHEHGYSAEAAVRMASRVLRVTEAEIRAFEWQTKMAERDMAEARATVLSRRIRGDANSDWGWAHRGRKSFARVM